MGRPLQDNISWNDFAVAMGRMNNRSLYHSAHVPGFQEARTGFFDSLKNWAPEHYDEMRQDNLEANSNLQNMIAMGMEDYKKDPLSREALSRAPFEQQIPLGATSSGLPRSGSGQSPNGINISTNHFNVPNTEIFHGGESFLTYDDLQYYPEGEYPNNYNFDRERQVQHEGLHTVLPNTGGPPENGYYSLFYDDKAKVIPDEEYRVRQLVNAYATNMNRPVPEFEQKHINPIDPKAADYFDKAVTQRRSNRSPHPTQKGFNFWDNLQDPS